MSNSNILDLVVERLRASPIGDLITEETLYGIVKEAIPKVFMQERVTKGTHWNSRDEIKPPLMFEVLQEVLSDHVRDAAKVWFIENHETVMNMWKKVFDQGITEYVEKAMRERTIEHMRAILSQYATTINEDRAKMNLPPIGFPT